MRFDLDGFALQARFQLLVLAGLPLQEIDTVFAASNLRKKAHPRGQLWASGASGASLGHVWAHCGA